ncbi:Cyclic nucleotide-binding domain-containing protein [Sulfurivirga caldicuralii]|uniref:Cyclic nucleotide-binding domain-containing protein n=1 Tax=Sulfurivirga caldicuralii TaxID=364032 RepID=A0A1N6FGJ1_9GAMM|nr:cyclic nucleotide-binding domain-containing protein [Sulfurivirga caldicuralii]SIN94365.1 Cyclic nucleotide-binding domain-containing protein [Sulfurivirga caldicuralii]
MKEITPEQLYDFFQQYKICESLTRDEVKRLSNYLHERHYKQGDIISDMGEVGEALYYVYEGKVGFYSKNGHEVVEVGTQPEGTLIGEMSFFDRKPRNLRMQADSREVILLELTRPMYDRLKVEEPYIAVNILENAIVSLDHLVRTMSQDISAMEHYLMGTGKR